MVNARVPLAGGGEAVVRLGGDFLLPAGAEAEIGALDGVFSAEISAMTQPLHAVS